MGLFNLLRFVAPEAQRKRHEKEEQQLKTRGAGDQGYQNGLSYE